MLLAPFKLALKIVGVIAAVMLLYVAITFVQVWETSHANDPHPANAVLVFGTATDYTAPAPDLEARLDRALGLWRHGLVPLIAVTGGKLPGDAYTEAQISAMWLEANHVPSRDIVQGGGDDSWQNVAAVAPTLHADDVRSVFVVTDPFHEDRAMAIASSFGFSPSPTPSLHSPIRGITQLGYLVKESVEVAAGRIVGYGTLSSIGQW